MGLLLEVLSRRIVVPSASLMTTIVPQSDATEFNQHAASLRLLAGILAPQFPLRNNAVTLLLLLLIFFRGFVLFPSIFVHDNLFLVFLCCHFSMRIIVKIADLYL
jgi:hypothetical protein